MRRWIGLFALVAALVAPGATTAADQPENGRTALERTSAIVQPSITYLETTFSAKVLDKYDNTYLRETPFTVTFSCTGFFVNPNGWVATAGHCVAYDDDTRAALVEQAAAWLYEELEGEYSQEDVLEYAEEYFVVRGPHTREVTVSWGVAAAGIEQSQTLPARLEGYKAFERGDVALLKIEATNLPALELDADSEVVIGEEVIAVGFPESVDRVTDATKFDPSFKDGTVSSKKTMEGGLVQVYEVSASVSGGMSGGPTVNADGDVVGINSFGIFGETQPFNFATPASEMLRLLRAAGVRNEIGTPNELYRAGIEAYWAGDKEEAVAKLDEAIESLPSFAAAQQYRSKAGIMPDPKRSFPWLFVAIGAFALVAVVTLLVALTVRRRPGRGGAQPAAATPAFALEGLSEASATNDRAGS